MLKNLMPFAFACAAALIAPGTASAQVAAPAAAGKAGAAEPLRVGFVYVSPMSELAGRRSTTSALMEKALGDKARVSVVDKVAEGADAERVILRKATG